MGGVNKVILVGNLGADPDMRYTNSGNGVCELRVATTESWLKDGQKQEKTEWHRVVVWGKRAESVAKYLSKGRQVYVEGRISTRDYEDKNKQKRYITEIIASDVQFLGGRGEGGSTGRSAPAPMPADNADDPGSYGKVDDDQIPF